MDSVLIAALVAATPIALPASADPQPLDLRCFRLMAELAEDEDPRIRSVGRVGAQYFLGRIDAAAPGFDPGTVQEEASGEDAGTLLRQCGEVMDAGGHDFRTIGEALTPAARPAA